LNKSIGDLIPMLLGEARVQERSQSEWPPLVRSHKSEMDFAHHQQKTMTDSLQQLFGRSSVLTPRTRHTVKHAHDWKKRFRDPVSGVHYDGGISVQAKNSR
jgi:hypothetical protein